MFKKIAIIGALMVGYAGAVHAQGMPVIDVDNLLEQIQQVAAWGQQLDQMQNQLQQMQTTYKSISGTRGLGQLMNNPALMNALPPQWAQVYTAIQKGGYQGLTSSGEAVRNANMIYNCQGKTGADLTLCQRDLNKTAQDKGFGLDAYQAAQARLTNIQGLMAAINSTTDAKSIAELGARIQSEQAMIQNEQTKLQLFKMLADAEKDLITQQKHETDMKRSSLTDSVQYHLSPVQF
jgi:type IV secretion system protein VirB5